MKLKLSELGESVCLKLKGKTKEGVLLEKVKKGTWVIFYDEIPGVAIGSGKFLIYPNASKECINKLNKPKNTDLSYNFVPEKESSRNSRSWYEDCIKTHKRIYS